jgi:4-amino-4-deoxy-L-arabinose transferase-like glycosyltransferase
VYLGLALACARRPREIGIRESLLRAALLLGALVLVATELLSLFDAITQPVVAILWVALAGGTLVTVFRTYRRTRAPTPPREPRAVPYAKLPALACAVVLALTLLTAVAAPPNYPDSMTYHLSRVAHWIQNRTIDWYPAADLRQNYQMPFAEIGILHLQLLSGGDRWANLVQWAAFALSGLTVSLILDALGQSARVQWAGALVAYTIPMAVLQASGSQNDLVVSLWLLAFLFFLWRALEDRAAGSAALCGLALGLALATKGTAYVYAPAMSAGLLAGRLAIGRSVRFPPLRGIVLALLVAVGLNAGIWTRTASATGVPVCCGEKYFVAQLTPAGAVTNVLRNVASHLGVPRMLEAVPRAVERLSPADIDDPAITFGGEEFVVFFSRHEGKAGNTLFVLVFLGAAIAIAVDRRSRGAPAAAWLAAVTAGFLAYSLVLRWQPWATRLHTPAFLVGAVPVALALGALPRRLLPLLATLLFLGALPYLLMNQSRPLLPMWEPSILTAPRTDQYYVDRRGYQEPYTRAAAFVRGLTVEEVGLLFDGNDYEYPFWVALKGDFAGEPWIRHVGLAFRPGADPAAAPPAVVVSSRRARERRSIDGAEYVLVRDFGRLSVLRRVGP